MPGVAAHLSAGTDTTHRVRAIALEVLKDVALMVAAYYAYIIAKNIIHPAPYAQAFHNAWSVVRLERAMGIFQENDLQRWLLHEAKGVVLFFNWVYTLGFWPVIMATAVIFFVKDRITYYKYRSVMMVSFAVAVVIFAIYPLAPPKMLGYMGFVDTIELLGPFQYATSSELLSYNKYAAMPSMHFGLAFLMSMAWASTSYRWAKIAAVVYQTLMVGAVVITGNHYFLDVILAIPIIVASYYIYILLWLPSNQRTHEDSNQAKA
ncbi:MAG: phosphatase PAP2 family protein [Chloroflexi bacterium]|nr:phosphatase PAP2 family protein [Chloroflexota bacterium]